MLAKLGLVCMLATGLAASPLKGVKDLVDNVLAHASNDSNTAVVPQAKLGADNPESKKGSQNISNIQPVSGFQAQSPVYKTFSDFDFQSINLATHQEYIELDLFNFGLARFSDKDFAAQNMTREDQALLRFFAQQEVGHARLLSNMLGEKAPKQCTYQYPNFKNVSEYIDFNQKLTKWGESGVFGFLNLLDNRAVGQNLLQSISTESRQAYTFRQWLGLFPTTEYFEAGLPQSWAWTLLHPYIKSCPSQNVPVAFEIYPTLTIGNNPSGIAAGLAAGGSAVAHNVSALSYPGRETLFSWDATGKVEGPYKQKTLTHTKGVPKFAAWVNQLNVTYTELYDVDKKGRTAKAKQPPFAEVFPGVGSSGAVINSTMFVALTDTNTFFTTANLTFINKHVVAGPVVFQAG